MFLLTERQSFQSHQSDGVLVRLCFASTYAGQTPPTGHAPPAWRLLLFARLVIVVGGVFGLRCPAWVCVTPCQQGCQQAARPLGVVAPALRQALEHGGGIANRVRADAALHIIAKCGGYLPQRARVFFAHAGLRRLPTVAHWCFSFPVSDASFFSFAHER
jgi:hypothetical protein